MEGKENNISNFEKLINNRNFEGKITYGKVVRKKKWLNYDYFYEHKENSESPKKMLKAKKTFLGYDVFDISENECKLVYKIESNFSGTRYTMIVDGSIKWMMDIGKDPKTPLNPWNMTIIGHENELNTCLVIKDVSDFSDIPGYFIFKNKPPYYDSIKKILILDFNGRVTVPSVKNFQILHPIIYDIVLYTFGKIGKDTFNCDFTFPFDSEEAFFFAICVLDFKIWIRSLMSISPCKIRCFD